MLLGLPEDQQGVVVALVAKNLNTVLQQQLSASASGLEGGEGLVQSKAFLINTHAVMQYMESLLENFSLGERGLQIQFPLGMVSISG